MRNFESAFSTILTEGLYNRDSGTDLSADLLEVPRLNLAPDGELGIVGAVGNGGGNFGDVAALADGGYVVTWTNITAPNNIPAGFETSINFVAARVFNADGSARTETFQVNTTTDFEQTDARVTALNGGGFVVSFTNGPIADGSVEAGAQVYDAQGVRVGTELQLNTVTTDDQAQPSIGALPDGGFIAVWVDAREGGSNDRHLWGSYFDEAGNRVGTEFQIARFGIDEFHAEVTVSGDTIFIAGDSGVYVVTGEPTDESGVNILPVIRAGTANRQIGDEISLIGTENGGALQFTRGGSNIEVNGISQTGNTVFNTQLLDDGTFEFNDVRVDAVALAEGGYLAVWQQSLDDGNGNVSNNIYSQLIDANGRKFGTNQLVTTATNGEQVEPWVTQLTDGTLIIGWSSDNQLTGAAPQDLYTQRFDIPAEFAAANIVAGLSAELAGGGLSTITDGAPAGFSTRSSRINEAIGDVNGDGINDVFILDQLNRPDPSDSSTTGLGFIVYGNADGITSGSLDTLGAGGADQTFSFGEGVQFSGLQTIGDMNGDGLTDVIIQTGFGNRGSRFVLFGTEGGLSGEIDLNALDGSEGFGLSDDLEVFSDGFSHADINGDGLSDLIINASSGQDHHVVYGRSSGFDAALDLENLTADQGLTFSDSDAGNISRLAGRDFNGDGIDDLLISVFADGEGQQVVYFGSANGPDINAELLSPTAAQGQVVSFLDIPGTLSPGVDFNNDGFIDLLRSGSSAEGGTVLRVYFGDADGFPLDTDFSLTGIAPDVLFVGEGNVFSNAATGQYEALDFNGDGVEDIALVQSFFEEGENFPSGERLHIVYGSETETGTITFDASNSFTLDNLIESGRTPELTNLGDVNGDGFEDLAYNVGSTGFLQTGGAVIIYGRAETDAPSTGPIDGDAGDNTLQGGAQGDVINGGAGNDVLLGDVAQALSLESIEGQVYRAYQAVFNRTPDLAGFEAFAQELRLGNLTQEQIITQFVDSTEFQLVYGTLSNRGFMEQLFQNLFNRSGDEQSLVDFTATLDGGRSRADVVVELSNTPEFLALMTIPSAAFASNAILHPAEGEVFRIYQAVFDRKPDAGGFTNFVNSIQASVLTIEQITAEFVASPEFQLTYGDLTSSAFVEQLYANVLPGNTDAQGRSAFTAALDGMTLTRAAMVAEFSQSPEFRANQQVAAESFVATIFADSGDVLSGGLGNDTLFGGRGPDIFNFDTALDGTDVILDFTSGADVIALTGGRSFDSFAEIFATGSQVAQDTLLDFGGGNTLTLNNVILTELTGDDFGLAPSSSAEKQDTIPAEEMISESAIFEAELDWAVDGLS